MRVRALRLHVYDQNNYKKGDEYNLLNPKHLKVLIAANAVEVLMDEAPVSIRSYQSGHEDYNSSFKQGKSFKLKVRKKGTYSRRDMRAETGE